MSEHPEHRDGHRHGIRPYTDEHGQDRLDATTHRSGMTDEGKTDEDSHDDENHAPDVVGLSSEPVADPFPERHEQARRESVAPSSWQPGAPRPCSWWTPASAPLRPGGWVSAWALGERLVGETRRKAEGGKREGLRGRRTADERTADGGRRTRTADGQDGEADGGQTGIGASPRLRTRLSWGVPEGGALRPA